MAQNRISSKTRRFFSAVIDGIILSILLNITIKYLYLYIVLIIKWNTTFMVPSLFVFFALEVLLFYTFQYLLLNNTFGKAFLKIEVREVNGEKLGLIKFLCRYILREISNIFFAAGSIFAFTNSFNFAIYDLALNTNVYYKYQEVDVQPSFYWKTLPIIIYAFFLSVSFYALFNQLSHPELSYNTNSNHGINISFQDNLYFFNLADYEKINVNGTTLHLIYIFTGYNYREGYVITENSEIKNIYYFSLRNGCNSNCSFTNFDKLKIREESKKLLDFEMAPGSSYGNVVGFERVQ